MTPLDHLFLFALAYWATAGTDNHKEPKEALCWIVFAAIIGREVLK